ncbi:hypothetical protein RISK_005354 [Rhodopirellula islandica]|uniref:Uncharacterized protein n=1 Tax=Rhodopirellula islandica TaxID=595434 RepID=A0A0J1B6R2_RHOIS|nr:hypothetical protein RISK_005354 [Rhodopirellula islandica]
MNRFRLFFRLLQLFGEHCNGGSAISLNLLLLGLVERRLS